MSECSCYIQLHVPHVVYEKGKCSACLGMDKRLEELEGGRLDADQVEAELRLKLTEANRRVGELTEQMADREKLFNQDAKLCREEIETLKRAEKCYLATHNQEAARIKELEAEVKRERLAALLAARRNVELEAEVAGMRTELDEWRGKEQTL